MERDPRAARARGGGRTHARENCGVRACVSLSLSLSHHRAERPAGHHRQNSLLLLVLQVLLVLLLVLRTCRSGPYCTPTIHFMAALSHCVATRPSPWAPPMTPQSGSTARLTSPKCTSSCGDLKKGGLQA